MMSENESHGLPVSIWKHPLIFGFNPPNKGIAVDRKNKTLLIFRIKGDENVGFGDSWDPAKVTQYIGQIQFACDESIDSMIRALKMLKEKAE